MKHISLILISGLTILSLTRCKSDFDIYAPYSVKPVVFGMMDISKDTQYVKINRSFLINGDKNQIAKNKDSLLFKQITASVEEIISGRVTRRFNLQPISKPVDNGIFYGKTQTVYYVSTGGNPLKDNAEYRFSASMENGKYKASSRIKPVEKIEFSKKFRLLGFSGYAFANLRSSVTNQYGKISIGWKSGKNAIHHQLSMAFHYTDSMQNGTTKQRKLNWTFNPLKAKNENGGENMFISVNGASFYQFIAKQLKDLTYENNVVQRKFVKITFKIEAYGKDMSTYLSILAPSTSINDTKPDYTNITGGKGIFSSQYTAVFDKKSSGENLSLSTFSLRELENGQYTRHLKFVEP